MDSTALECRLLSPEWEESLIEFFGVLALSGADTYFHPHPLTDEEARRRCYYVGRDLYYVLAAGKQILGYGMLRGWDEGYERPSLGIVVHPAMRGQGLGRTLMSFLHAAARLRGARQIRLKVFPDNASAVRLYRSLGYEFSDEEAGQLVGVLSLHD